MSEPRHIGDGLAEARSALGRSRAVDPDREARLRAVMGDADYAAAFGSEGEVTLRREARDRAEVERVIPRRFRGATLERVEDANRAALERWLDADWPAPNVLLFGAVGTGKTSAACAVATRLVLAGRSAMFVPVAEMLAYLRPGGPEGYMADLLAADVLVLDDLGQERPSEWTYEQVEIVVNRRWLDERPVIATTNQPGPAELEAIVGERVASRLAGSGALGLRFAGKDRRRAS